MLVFHQWRDRSRFIKSPLTLPFVSFLLIRFAILLLEVPTVRLLERSICERHFRHISNATNIDALGHVDETRCKIAAAQDTLATVVGWKMSFDAIPALLSALTYGRLADTHGRRPILILCCLGMFLMLSWMVMTCYFDVVFPTEIAWLSSIFLFLGGGTRVFLAIIVATVSDSTTDSQRARYLFLLASLPHLLKLVTPRIASTLMATNVFLPFKVSLTVIGLCIVFIYCSPEPERAKGETFSGPIESSQLLLSETVLSVRGTSAEAESVTVPVIFDLSLLHNLAMAFCFTAFYFKSFAMTSESFIFQYASQKFDRPLRETTWLRIALAFGAVITTLMICPWLATTLTRRGFAPQKLDLNIIRGSLLILSVFMVLAWRSTSWQALVLSMVGCGLGEGLEPALQAFLSFLSKSTRSGQVFATVAMFDILGEMTGGPVSARLMAVGRGSGSVLEGYCFLASAIVFVVLGILACWVRTEDGIDHIQR